MSSRFVPAAVARPALKRVSGCVTLRRSFRWALASLVAASMLGSSYAHADQRVSFYAEQLRASDDYRVRVQAALSLGASADESAVSPLCAALAGDGNAAVRVAAAAALGRLGKQSGEPCLHTAKARESSAAVKGQIDRSLAALGGSQGADSAELRPGTKYYVVIQVTNRTSRPAPEVESLVRGAMQAKLVAQSTFAVAPKGQSSAQAGQIVKDKKLKGFLLTVTVEAPVYASGNLTQILRVGMLTHPGGALRGQVAPKLTQTDTPSADPQGEVQLMKMCAENAAEQFQKIVGAL
jgi:hypothetical protein